MEGSAVKKTYTKGKRKGGRELERSERAKNGKGRGREELKYTLEFIGNKNESGRSRLLISKGVKKKKNF